MIINRYVEDALKLLRRSLMGIPVAIGLVGTPNQGCLVLFLVFVCNTNSILAQKLL